MNIEEIEFNGKLLAYIIHGTFDITGQQFAGDTEDFLQIGVMRLPGGTKLKSHYHLPQKKLITKNQEVLIVLSGKIEVLFFDIDEKTEVGSRILKGGDIIALLDGGHGFNILSETKLIEVKQGPYEGQEKDKCFL